MPAAVLAATLFAAPVPAQTARPPELAALVPPPAAPSDTAATELLLGVQDNRMTVPVSIAARGPWPFIIDTGAERTVVSRQLVQTLALPAGPAVRIVAMTGPAVVATATVAGLRTAPDPAARPAPAIVAPVLEAAHLGAAGLLGIDTLQNQRVEIDFDRSTMAVRPSHRRTVVAGAHGDEVVVVAQSRMGQLIVTDARWHGRRVAVVIDTGSAMSVGNPALLRMVAARARPAGPTAAVSVTGATLNAQGFVLDQLSIGGIGLENTAVAIADAAPFRRFGLEKRPAIMLGMDMLRLFRRVRIDFANRDIELTLPRGMGAGTTPFG